MQQVLYQQNAIYFLLDVTKYMQQHVPRACQLILDLYIRTKRDVRLLLRTGSLLLSSDTLLMQGTNAVYGVGRYSSKGILHVAVGPSKEIDFDVGNMATFLPMRQLDTSTGHRFWYPFFGAWCREEANGAKALLIKDIPAAVDERDLLMGTFQNLHGLVLFVPFYKPGENVYSAMLLFDTAVAASEAFRTPIRLENNISYHPRLHWEA